jgi:HD-GYP domain-containing protein (c-di-GMP phosphodiesterase class II)
VRSTGSKTEAKTGGEILADRCKELGLPTWRVDEQGQIVAQPSGWGPPDHWLRSPLLNEWISRAVSAWCSGFRSKLIELLPGCWIIPLSDGGRSYPPIITVAMALGGDSLQAEQFEAICSEGRLDASISRTALAPLARYRRSDHERLVRTLRWMHEDLLKAQDQGESIEAFSDQLSDCYEQIAHLYELSRAINCLHEPDEFVELACSRLQRTLDFNWIAAAFPHNERIRTILRSPLFVAGNLPCERRRLQHHVSRLELSPDQRGIMLTSDDSKLASLVRGPVLVEPVLCSGDVAGILLAGNKQGFDTDISSIDIQLLRATAEYVGSFVHSAASYHEQRTMFLGTIRAITYTIEAKDRYTRGHSERVAHLAAQLATSAGIDSAMVPRIRLAGMLHDVGKIGVPEAVLRKPGQLTDEEFDAIKRHPVIGYAILRDIGPLQDILPGVLHHHERWDGGGYPQGLAGEAIPLIARLLAIADTFDAMCSDRAYRSARPRKRVVEEMARMGGTQLDPELTQVFLKLDKSDYDRMIAGHLANDGGTAA